MSDVRSTNIIPIGFYCMVLSLVPVSITLNELFTDQATMIKPDNYYWIQAVATLILSSGLFTVGLGFFYTRHVSWLTLFFFLAISVSGISSLLLAYLGFLLVGINILFIFFRVTEISPVIWFSFLSFYLSEIIVLYYLTRPEVIVCFEDLGERLNPFGLY